MRRLAPLIPALAAVLLAGCRPTVDPEAWEALPYDATEVRVLLAADAEQVLVAFPDGGRLLEPGGETLYRVPAGWELVFWLDAAGNLVVNGELLTGSAVVLAGDTRPGEPPPRLVHDNVGYRPALSVERTPTGLRLINALDVEDYLRGVLPAEVYVDWPAAALEAQAVVSRSYALARAWAKPSAPWHLRADTASQVYGGLDREDDRTSAAVTTTENLVVLHEEELVTAFFSACCGGHTAAVDDAWPGSPREPWLTGVECPWCADSPHAAWELRLEFAELSGLLVDHGYCAAPLSGLQPLTNPRTGRVRALEFVTVADESFSVPGNELRRLLGYSRLKSTRFELVDIDESGLILRGSGYGHGVGLCQWGARGMAAAERTAAEIIEFYFPGCRVADYRELEPPPS
jgi:stage II sporulation protein D